MGIVSVNSFLFSLISALILTPLIRNLALKVHAFEKIDTDIQQEKRIPYLGGLSVFFSFLIATLFMSFHQDLLGPEFTAILIGSIIIILLDVRYY